MQTAYSAYRERRYTTTTTRNQSCLFYNETSLLWPIPWHNTFIAAHLTDASF